MDLACGAGANALWLAARGFRTLGVDVSLEGLRIASAEGRRRGLSVQWVGADAGRLPFADVALDVIVVMCFHDRRLFPWLAQVLRPGGLLFYRAFNRNVLEERPRMNPAFVLAPGELRAAFAHFETLDSSDGEHGSTSYLVARRPG